MKILFYGDSITDAGRARDKIGTNDALGCGFVRDVSSMLLAKDEEHEIINTGISGNRIVDLYARVKMDFWNHKPELVSILIGINDIWHEIMRENGVELERYENIYRTMLRETKERLPDTKIMLCEPFVLRGSATEEAFERFLEVEKYAKVVKELSEEFGASFVPLQAVLTAAAEKYGSENILADGVHPAAKGASLIAKEWVRAFEVVG